MKLVYLRFDDPASLDDWHTKEESVKELKATIGYNEAVGWIIKEDDAHYYLTSHKTAESVSASLKVPKAIVIEKKIIKL